MYEHSRHTSESSNETNGSGSTAQTNVPADDVIADSTEASEAHTDQAFRYLDELRDETPTVDSELHRKTNKSQSAKGIKYGNTGYSRIPVHEKRRTHLWTQSQDDSFITHGEAIPFLSSEREALIIDIVRSNEFRKIFEHEYEDTVKFRKRYKSLKKYFSVLSVLNIVLIICAVFVMPVILVSLRLERSQVTQGRDLELSLDSVMEEFIFEQLESERAKVIIRKNTAKSGTFKDDALHRIEQMKEEVDKRVDSKLQTVRESIDRLENAVIDLQGSNTTKIGTTMGKFQKTLVHTRVEKNNELLNKLINRKRSSIQLIGTFENGQIQWKKDVSNGGILSKNSKGIHVQSGGTYLLYAKIKFSKGLCKGSETFAYSVIEDTNGAPAAYIKEHCSSGGSFEGSLNIQRIVTVRIFEQGTFYIKIDSVDPSVISTEIRAHVFSMIEI